MSVKKCNFGTLTTGKEVYRFVLENRNGTKAVVSNYGALLISLWFKDKYKIYQDLVLGYDTLSEYEYNNPMFGAVVGRNVNRISNAQFILDDKKYNLQKNRGKHNIHSDKNNGFHKVVWDYIITGENSVQFSYISPDGEQGFPGTVKVFVTYTLTETDGLILSYYASTDKKTLLNLTNHSYFNIGGNEQSDILDTLFYINADFFTPVDTDIIPTGEIISVSNTPMDFRNFSNIRERINDNYEQIKIEKGFDHNYVINNPNTGIRKVAEARNNKSGIVMELYSDMPGLQFYTSNSLNNENGKRNNVYNAYSGFCMEPDYFPNAINTEGFEKPIFDEHKEFKSTTIYQFYVLEE